LKTLKDVEADLLVLPELPFTGYYFKNRTELGTLAENPRTSPIVEALIELCKKQGFYIATGFAEKDGSRLFNSSLLIGPRGILQTYRKIHLFNEEKKWFDPGDLPPRVKQVRGVRIGMMICFDWVFPEITRTLALQGMDLLCHPSNLVLKEFCQQAMLTRCLENAVFAVTTNRCGEDHRPHGSVRFTGQSQIAGPRGELLFRAQTARSVLRLETIDPLRSRNKALTPRNHLFKDRRPELYFT
jgi:predicted amidohydrolase